MKFLELLSGTSMSETLSVSDFVDDMGSAGYNRKQLDSIVSSFRNRGYLDVLGRGKFKITKEGMAFVKDRDKLEVINYSSRVKPAKEPQEPSLNVSLEADSMLNNLTTVIQQNAEYRNLLLSLYNTIGNSLQLNDINDKE